jgi:hypothetical protein
MEKDNSFLNVKQIGLYGSLKMIFPSEWDC